MPDAIEAVRDAFKLLADGSTWQPQRLVTPEGSMLVMAARGPGLDGTAIKVVSIREGSDHRPSIVATILWVDFDTGEVTAILDGGAATALRTGAGSGVATDLLAAPEATVLAMIGTGAQAPDQIRAVCSVRRISDIRVAARSAGSAQRFVEAFRPQLEPHVSIRAASTPKEAVEGADVICCATTSKSPLFDSAALSDRVHINAVGSFRLDMRELAVETLGKASQIVVDRRDATLAEAGDVVEALNAAAISLDSLVEISSLLNYRTARAPVGVTVFKSVGVAMQDWAIARIAVDRAQAAQIGSDASAAVGARAS